jgi:hypothetical protein
MAEVNEKKLMRHCCEVNCKYMRLPAGSLDEYRNIAGLYQRLADQSLLCSQAWLQDEACPGHEPAADAFWWAVTSWAEAFGISIGADMSEWERVFVRPHHRFADYLLCGPHPEVIEPHAGLPADTILELDVRWMKLVVSLTSKWGMLAHLKDMPALHEAQRLEKALRAENGAARAAYLKSDLNFFRELFRPFPFEPHTRQQLNDWLAMADPDNKQWRDR